MKIDIVIPNYNGAELIKKNLPDLIDAVEKYDIGKIIISDDCSHAEDFKNLSEFLNIVRQKTKIKIELIENLRNVGFSSNVNVGVSKTTADFVLLLNTDVSANAKFLDAALKDLENNENLFGVGLMDKSEERGKVVLRGRGLATWKRGFLVHRRGEVDSKDTFWISGGSCIFRRELFIRLGGFDQSYNPFYWEDIDLSYRARKSGYEVMFEPESEVIHRHEEGTIKRHFKSSHIKKIAYRNQFVFVWKNITDIKLLISHFFWLPVHLIKAILRMDLAFIAGFFAAINKIPAIIGKRRKQKKLYKKKDVEIIPNEIINTNSGI